MPEVAKRLAPGGILRLGAAPVSKALNLYLERHLGAPQWVVDQAPGWRDPAQVASHVLWAEPRRLVEALAQALEDGSPADPGWAELWRRLEATTAAVLAQSGEGEGEGTLFEGRVFPELLP